MVTHDEITKNSWKLDHALLENYFFVTLILNTKDAQKDSANALLKLQIHPK